MVCLYPYIYLPAPLRQLPFIGHSRVYKIESNTYTAGVKSYEVSLESQTATVITELPYETVLQTIKKTGKKVNSGEEDGEEKPIDL